MDSGRNPYATNLELVQEILDPAHPTLPHADYWQSPQFNKAITAESEYADRYLGYWNGNDPASKELAEGSFAKLPLDGQQFEQRRILSQSHGTMQGPHGDILLDELGVQQREEEQANKFQGRSGGGSETLGRPRVIRRCGSSAQHLLHLRVPTHG